MVQYLSTMAMIGLPYECEEAVKAVHYRDWGIGPKPLCSFDD